MRVFLVLNANRTKLETYSTKWALTGFLFSSGKTAEVTFAADGRLGSQRP